MKRIYGVHAKGDVLNDHDGRWVVVSRGIDACGLVYSECKPEMTAAEMVIMGAGVVGTMSCVWMMVAGVFS